MIGDSSGHGGSLFGRLVDSCKVVVHIMEADGAQRAADALERLVEQQERKP